jgi:zinc transporter
VISFAYRLPHALDEVERQFLSGTINDPGDLITAFATVMSAGLDPVIAAIGDTLDDIEAEVDEHYSRSTRRKVSLLRAEAISYRRFIAPQREALTNFSMQRHSWLDEQDRLHLRTAADRYARMAEELEAVRERAAIVHDEITDLRGEQMDGRGLLMSIIALIFLPLTFITGLLGMNVQGIPYAEEPWSFWGVVAFCVLVGLAVIGWFVRLRWVRGR